MKLPNLTILLVALVLLSGCDSESARLDDNLDRQNENGLTARQTPLPVKTNLPPGWSFVCEPGGRFSWREPNGRIGVAWVSTNRAEVVDGAWRMYGIYSMPPHPSRDYNWTDCDK